MTSLASANIGTTQVGQVIEMLGRLTIQVFMLTLRGVSGGRRGEAPRMNVARPARLERTTSWFVVLPGRLDSLVFLRVWLGFVCGRFD
jgi:hypothetical protein